MKAVRIFFVVINSLLVIALLLSGSAGWFSPSKFDWASVFSYGFLPLVVLNVVCSLLWLFFKRWEFLISLIAILLRGGMIPLFIQIGGTDTVPQSEQRSQADEFAVMTYNVHGFCGNGESQERLGENAQRFIDVVRHNEPDVICVQEFFDLESFVASDSLKALGYEYQYSARCDKKGRRYGASIFSRWRIDFVQTFDAAGRKVFADISKDKFKVRVACVHMSSYSFGNVQSNVINDMKNKEIDADNAQRLISKVRSNVSAHEKEWNEDLAPLIAETPYPLVVAGDLNDTPASYLYYKISRKLKDSYVDEGKGFGVTYNGLFPHYRIDYIFHSESLKTLAYKRLASDFSDHNGVMAVYERASDS